MKKRIICGALIVFILSVTSVVYAQVSGNQSVDPVDSFETKSIKCQYVDDKSARETVFDYNDGLFLNDATTFSPDVAKVSAVLAAAAYKPEMITDIFSKDKLDFELVGDKTYNYDDRDGNINDMDYVAYSFARKEIEYDGQKYALYCIPVRGTPGSIEWFSNFKLGQRDDGYHQGFYLAADEIISNIEAVVTANDENNENGIPKERRIIWIMGHSRGAAVSNLVAGRLSTEQNSVATAEHIFCYTYACPAVGKNVDTTLDNIYNFNNPGDDVTTLPFEEWGYKRFGHTESLDLSQYDNFCQQYKSISGSEYAGITNTVGFKNVFKQIVKSEEDYHSADNQMLFGIAAFALDNLDGEGDCTFTEMVNYTGYNIATDTLTKIKNCVNVSSLKETVENIYNDHEEKKDFLGEAIVATSVMSEDEFENYLKENESKLNAIEQIIGTNIETKTDLSTAYSALITGNKGNKQIVDMTTALIGWIFDAKGNVLGTFTDGHRQGTYVTWINSMYYGYSGWMMNEELDTVTNEVTLSSTSDKYSVRFIGNNCFYDCDNINNVDFNDKLNCIGKYAFYNCDNLASVTIPNNIQSIRDYAFQSCSGLLSLNLKEGQSSDVCEIAHTIGDRAFYGCSSLQTAVIPDRIEIVGESAFRDCTSLEEVTMPADLEYVAYAYEYEDDIGITHGHNESTFYNCKGVKKIHYTKGQTGIMPDYKASYSVEDKDYFLRTIERYASKSLESVILDEGIVNVGDYTFYGASTLVTADMPDSVTEIGEYAFYGCTNLSAITSENIKTIDSYAFYKCENLKTINFKNLEGEIPKCAFYKCSSLQTIELPDGIETVGSSAFYGCSSLQTLELPDGIDTVGDWSFYGCSSLQTLVIPDGIETVGNGAFQYCTKLEDVTIPVDLTYHALDSNANTFEGCTGVKRIHYTKGKTGVMTDYVGGSMFGKMQDITTLEGYSRKSLESVILDEGIINVGDRRFYYNTALTTIDLPDSVTEIGEYAFYRCESLKTVNFENLEGEILQYAFYGCTSLQTAVISDNVTGIGSYAFSDCTSLQTVVIPDGIETVGEVAFSGCANLEDVTMPADLKYYTSGYSLSDTFCNCTGVKRIHYTKGQTGVMLDYGGSSGAESVGRLERYSSESLESVILDEGIINIGDYRFYDNTALTTVDMPDSVTKIGEYAFYGCESLKTVNFENLEGEIPQYAFYGCTSLQTAVISDKVTGIGNYAFSDCTSLQTAVIPDGIETIGNGAFGDCTSLADVTMPVDLKYYASSSSSDTFCNCTGVKKIHYTKGKTGVMPDYDGSSEFSRLESVILDEGIINIGDYRFYYNTALTTVDMPDSVTKIGEYAFYGCESLKTVNFENLEGEIPQYAFYGCTSLQTAVISDKVTGIGDDAFYGCTSLQTVELPDGIETIGSFAFCGCTSLTDVTMPVDVQYDTSVSTSTFSECAGVKKIHYTKGKTGVMPDYNINIETYNCSTLGFCARESLESVVLDEGIVHVGDYIFYFIKCLLNVKFPDSILTISDKAFSNGTSATFYGKKDSVVEEYANEKDISFIPLNYPMIIGDTSEVETDSTKQFSARVYTDIDQYSEDVTWSLEGNVSEETSISDSGLLSVSSNESATSLKIICEYNDEKANVTIPIIEAGDIVAPHGHNYENGVCSICNKVWEENINGIIYQAITEIGEDGKLVGQLVTVSENDVPYVAVKVIGIDETLDDNITDGKVTIPSEITVSGSEQTFVVIEISENAFSDVDVNEIEVSETVTKVGSGAFGDATIITFNGTTVPEGIASAISETEVTVNVPEEAGDSFREALKEVLGDSVTIVEIHIHTFDTKWTYDATYHWHASTCGHAEEIADQAEHTWDAGKVTKEATETEEGVMTYTCNVCGKTKTEAIPKKETTTPESPKKGDVVLDDKVVAKVEVADVTRKEVTYKEPVDKKTKTVTIPTTVKIDGVIYKVTKIADNAFKDNKTVTKVTIGSNIKAIGKNAFYGATKLKTVSIGKNVTEIGAYAFKGCSSLTSVTLPSKTTKIGAYAFSGCKKIKTIKITSTKLTSKTVAKNAFKGLTKATTIKVPKKKLTDYMKLFKSKGLSSKVKMKGY
ncbi:MAG: leucine-rich repeat protein [Lachnospiraceae bacterium]